MNKSHPPKLNLLEQSFPLKRLFRRRFVPALIGFIVLFLILISFMVKQSIEFIYLELAQRRAQTISRAIAEEAPDAWKGMMAGNIVADSNIDSVSDDLKAAFSRQVRAMNLPELKVYNLHREVLFATHGEEIGTVENGEALRTVIKSAKPEIATKNYPDGTSQYELYVPVFDKSRSLRTVFELYEPVGYLDEILINAAIPIVAIPGLLLLFLAIALDRLVSRAQADIDHRTDAINELRTRIESFVSSTAIAAAKSAGTAGNIQSRNVSTTLFFSDIRDFTGFAEQNSPEVVVNFLNRIMTVQVEILKRHSGDVDKMIGDAVLARFDGEDGGKRAVSAAREILFAVKHGNFPRLLGIGVHFGEVISGAIGPLDRRDYTVIGDAVNVAARLCSAAKAGELVVAEKLADSEFGPCEPIQVKGRQEHLSIRRWAV